METALVIKWESRVVGREHQATESFVEALGYLGELKEAGKVTYVEPFFHKTGNPGGFILIKGEPEALTAMLDSERFKVIYSKALYLIAGLAIEYLFTGEEITEIMTLDQKAYADLGLAS